MKLNVLVCLCALLALPGLAENARAQSSPETSSARRLAAPIDESQRTALKGNVHPFALSQADRGLAPISAPTGRIALLLRRSTAQQQALTEYLSDLENPSSSAFHKWLTPAQYGAQFGVDPDDVQAIESWLQSHGFRIEKVPASGNVIVFSGTIDQVQSTFHTSIHAFAVEGETRFANVTDVSVPAALAPLIAGVGPLNNFRARPGAQVSARGTWDAASHAIEPDLTLFSGSNSYLFIDPADAATIYDSPNSTLNLNYTAGTSYTGTGATIGIVGVSNVNIFDIANYRTAFLGGLTVTSNLPEVVLDGNDPGVEPGGAGVEALLDNEVAGGLAPGARIDFYISAGSDLSDGLFNAIERAIDDNEVDILSISFGQCESVLGTSGNQLMLELSEQAAAQGISVTVSAGDNGSAGCDDFDTAFTAQDGLAVSGFASTPYVIAVGGTDFDVLSSSFSTYVNNNTNTAPYYRTAKSYIPEKPWNNTTTINASVSQNVAYKNGIGRTNIVAGSGGVSGVYGKPAFQSALTPADNARDLPDVSLFAGDGFYSAYWVVCADTVVTEGAQSPQVDCANSNGQFGGGATFTGVGGTSASAPALAGMLALAVQATGGRLGQADTVLYQLAQAHTSYFHDITSGDNSVPCTSVSPNCGANLFMSGYNAGTGYDLATGLGSLDAAAVINNWKSVSLGSTATTLQINGSNAAYTGVHGAALTLNADVTASSGTPTGAVAVTDNADLTTGGAPSGPQNNGQVAISLTAGAGSTTYNGLPGGSYTVAARYGGDTSYAASTSTPISVSISPEASTTALSVNAYNFLTGNSISNVNIPYGSYVIADAEIMGAAEGSNTQGLATGTVQFHNGGVTLGTATVSSDNEASWPPLTGDFVPLQAGSYSVTAQYSGDASYAPSNGTAMFTVAKAPTTVSVGYTGTPVEYGNQVAIVAGLTTTSTGVAPTGAFQYAVDGQAVVGPPPVFESSGYNPSNTTNPFAAADSRTTYAFLSPGQHSLSASYSGDTNYAGGTSPAQTVTVEQAPASINGSGFEPAIVGQSTTGSANISGSPYGVAPSGTVTFYDNNVALTDPVSYTSLAIPGTYSMLSATIQHVFTSAGMHAISVSYSGDTYYTSAMSAAQSLNVAGPISLSSSQLDVLTPGQSGSAMVSVTPHAGFTGAVNLTCAVTTSIKGGIDAPTCSLPASVTIAGTTAATATLSVQTTAGTVGTLESPLRRFLGGEGEVAVALVLLFGIPARRRRWSVLLGLLAFAFIAGAIGCGGGGTGTGGGQSFGTTEGSYTITVTGTDAATGKITANTTVALTVN